MRANPDLVEPGPLPWLAGIPPEAASHSAWGPYVAARSRRVSLLAAAVAADPVLPEWTAKYDDVLTPEIRHELAVSRAATGVPADERTLAGPVPHDDREVAYHRNLTGRINARYGEAVKTWADRIVEYVGRRDEQTGELAKYLDQHARKGIDAERILDFAAAKKPLPINHSTAALSFRVKDLATPRRQRRTAPLIDPFPRPEPASVRPIPGAVDRRQPQRGRYDRDMSETVAPAREPLSGPTGQRVAARRGELLEVLCRHGVTNPEIFGSAARGDDREDSDVDLLVDFPAGTDIIDIIGIKRELEDVLGVPVDLVLRNGLKERVRSRAAKDLLPL